MRKGAPNVRTHYHLYQFSSFERFNSTKKKREIIFFFPCERECIRRRRDTTPTHTHLTQLTTKSKEWAHSMSKGSRSVFIRRWNENWEAFSANCANNMVIDWEKKKKRQNKNTSYWLIRFQCDMVIWYHNNY